MANWLVKTEASVYSINDLQKDKRTLWDKVRNYQARNYLKLMEKEDLVLFYHSVEEPTGIFGLAKVVKTAMPDPTQFDESGEYFDKKATKENPRWFAPEIEVVEKFKVPVLRERLKKEKKLANMTLLQRGSRLSVQPVSTEEMEYILRMK